MWFSSGVITIWGMGVIGGALHNILQNERWQRGRREALTNVETGINPLSPTSDENEISPYMITVCSNIQVMRIKEKITKDKMS